MTTRALVVGIDAYAPPNALPSCVRDAQSFSELLTTTYQFGDVKTLTDDLATKDGVLGGLRWLFAQAVPGDQLVFFYSGHGYQPMVDGELREALVTQDSQFLDDTELAAAMASLPNGVLTIVLDTCFSGGLEKLFIDDQGAIRQVVKAKYWTPLPSAPDAARFRDVAQAKSFRPFGTVAPSASKGFIAAGSDATVTSLQLPASKGLLMSAAQADETASASTPATKGLSAFTYALLDAVTAGGVHSDAITLASAAGATLHRNGLRQTPAVKQPIMPPGMGGWSFLTLQPLQPTAAGFKPGTFAPQPQEISMILSQPSFAAPSMSMPWGTHPDKNWLDDLTSMVSAVVPVVVPLVAQSLQSKGFAPRPAAPALASYVSGGDAADKGWFDTVASIVNAVVPAVVPVVAQALQSKGFAPQPATWAPRSSGLGGAADKGWFESIAGIVSAVVPVVVPVVAQALQSKGFQSQAALAAPASFSPDSTTDKGWDSIVTSIVHSVVPVVVPIVAQALQSKGFAPQAAAQAPASFSLGGSADKGWFDTMSSIVSAVVPAVVPVVAQALQSKGFVARATASAPGSLSVSQLDEKGWLDIVTRVATTVAPVAIALL